jgi:hypothetical protein
MPFSITRATSFIAPLTREITKSFSTSREKFTGTILADKVFYFLNPNKSAYNDFITNLSTQKFLSFALDFSCRSYEKKSISATFNEVTSAGNRKTVTLLASLLAGATFSLFTKKGNKSFDKICWSQTLGSTVLNRDATISIPSTKSSKQHSNLLKISTPGCFFLSFCSSLTSSLDPFSPPKSFFKYSSDVSNSLEKTYNEERMQILYQSFTIPTSFFSDFNVEKALFKNDLGQRPETSIQKYFNIAVNVTKIAFIAFNEFSRLQEAIKTGKGTQETIIAKYLAKTFVNLAQYHLIRLSQGHILGSAKQTIDGIGDNPVDLKVFYHSIFSVAVHALLEGSFNHANKASGLDDYLT